MSLLIAGYASLPMAADQLDMRQEPYIGGSVHFGIIRF